LLTRREKRGVALQTETVPHIVIVGAGFGGLAVARGLRQAPAQITVIDRQNHFVFQPLLYQVATAALSPADISTPIRAALRHHANTSVLLAEVTGVDAAAHQIRYRTPDGMDERALAFDYLVLATGAQGNYFGHGTWANDAPGMKTLTDAIALRRRLLLAFELAEHAPDRECQQALLTFAIIGGGPTGVELAGAIAELGHHILPDFHSIPPDAVRVVLIEGSPRVLHTFPADLSAAAQRSLEGLGVEVHTGVMVQQVNQDGVIFGSEHLASKTVIWAAGVMASPAGNWLGGATDHAGRVQVRADLTVPEHPAIMVIGDTATLAAPAPPLPGVASVAIQQGHYVAACLMARLQGAAPGAKPFRYVDKGSLATIGRSRAVASVGQVHLHGTLAWLAWAGLHLFLLMGFRSRMLVFVQWAWAYVTQQSGARLITFASEVMLTPADMPHHDAGATLVSPTMIPETHGIVAAPKTMCNAARDGEDNEDMVTQVAVQRRHILTAQHKEVVPMTLITGKKSPSVTDRVEAFTDSVLQRVATIAPPALRISLSVIVLWIGLLKFSDPAPVVGLIQASPFHLFGNVGFVHFLGLLEVIAGALLLLNRLTRYVGLLVVLLFAATLSIFLTTPAVVYGTAGFPHLTLAGQFLLKDLVLAMSAITVAVQADAARHARAK
jgi:NADH dehydrogenase